MMEKQTINAVRSRARVAIHTTGGRVTGQHHRLPVVYACPPVGGPAPSVVPVCLAFSPIPISGSWWARLPGRFLLSRSRKKSRYGEWLFTCSSRLWLAFWGLAWLRH